MNNFLTLKNNQMKKLILFLIIIFTLSSCHYVKVYPENKQEATTTTQILKIAEKDTILYKKVVIKEEIYLLNTKTNLVEVRVEEDKSPFLSFLIILGLFGLAFIFGLVVGFSKD